jgi:hypothetical protein
MGFVVGLLVGGLGALFLLVAAGATPLDMEQKLCAEADWKLPSCVAKIEQAVEEAKGKGK